MAKSDMNLHVLMMVMMMVSCVILTLNVPLISSLQFSFSQFDKSLKEILYQGDATPNGEGGIQLTREDHFRVGWASYAQRVPIQDPKTGQVTDFTTHFSFIIDTRDRPYADGLAFFLAPFGSLVPLNSAGEWLGLLNTTTSSDTTRNQFIAVEFDIAANSIDPGYDHVGIDVNSLSSVVTSQWNASQYNRNEIDVWVVYNSSTSALTVKWANKTEPNSTMAHNVNLIDVLPQWAMVGFTASTGSRMSKMVIRSWEFSSTLNMPAGAAGSRDIRLILGLSLSIGPIFIAILLAVALKAKAKAKARCNSKDAAEDLFAAMNGGPHPFSYQDLALATNNFSEARKLGEGGFGSVYKGYLMSVDLLVAVKKISKRSKQGKKEYETEVKVISQLRHRNLVQLIGWCHDHRQGEFLLVYEFMPNGSLDMHLFGKRPQLDWATRNKIAHGLSSALLYLHEEWERCVIHRDIKSSNIMLDADFNVKLGDFGLARLADHEKGADTTVLAGTLGYMAPEYLMTGRASKESDVYSFGVVMLEIVTGRRCRDSQLAEFEVALVEWVWDLYGKGKALDAIDERLNRELNENEVECLMVVGLWCAHPDPTLRPAMKQVTRVLHFDSPLPILPPKMPVPNFRPAEEATTLVVDSDPLITSSSMQSGR